MREKIGVCSVCGGNLYGYFDPCEQCGSKPGQRKSKQLEKQNKDAKDSTRGGGWVLWTVVRIGAMIYVLLNSSFVTYGGRFAIMHKRELSLRNIVVFRDPENLAQALDSMAFLVTRYKGVIFGIGIPDDKVSFLEYWN